MGDLFAKLLVFEGELVDGADESGDVGTELLEFLVLVGDRFFELDNGRAQASFDVWGGAAFLDGARLYAWGRVIAPMVVIAHLTHGGPEPVIDELLALTR